MFLYLEDRRLFFLSTQAISSPRVRCRVLSVDHALLIFWSQDKRRLEREKTYYWGQAEELRMSAMAGGRADPTRDAEHAQLVEQARELIEENRELRQRAQVILGLFFTSFIPQWPLC